MMYRHPCSQTERTIGRIVETNVILAVECEWP